ncbi:OLC1v1007779C1 [Oldenlandia corymbosa var. corymbosa]|uniref:Queuine tRNA-ribosyltransferase accessory subunit 2 n=1 Tax=Oldenlandia corymbosa var. corymbosa TaxID=529605 RepID=A0AAV1DMG4_OLDCO|nr:OLC1v1007779C1 [Oldenlandia corymbosa var. corymbosa]
MKFAATAAAMGNGRARVGLLHLSTTFSDPIETPALLLTTRKGLPLFIPPDLLPSLPSPHSHLLQFSPLHFLEGISPKTISDVGGLHQMIGLHQHIFVAVPRDSITSIPEHQSTNKTGPSFHTPGGRLLIKPADYMQLVSSMKPDLFVSLADEVPAWVSTKRNTASVDRTLRWLDDCISYNKTGVTVFGSIVGGSRVEERQRCAQEVVKRNVSGYFIGGFGLGESMDERSDLLAAIMDNLPEDKPRQVSGLELPEEVLQGVAAGVDLFDSTYIYHLTIGGFALTLPLETRAGEFPDNELSDSGGSVHANINLKSTIYRKDTSPIIESCECYTCQNHTKAYLNHLFNVHEMLAQTLLEIHNTHHYLGFFRSIREAIKEGRFEQFRRNFIGGRRDNIFISAPSDGTQFNSCA